MSKTPTPHIKKKTRRQATLRTLEKAYGEDWNVIASNRDPNPKTNCPSTKERKLQREQEKT